MYEKMEVNDYLSTLKSRAVLTKRPFDTNTTEAAIELGLAARTLTLPVLTMERMLPPGKSTIETFYRVLKPVLQELEHYDEFDWTQNYGTVTAKDVAKGYLFNAIAGAREKDTLFTAQEIAFQVFLRHVSDALVDGIEPDNAVESFKKKSHVLSQFNSMVLSLSMQIPTKDALIESYVAENQYTKVYLASLFTDEDFEKKICQELHKILIPVIDLINEQRKPHFWNKTKTRSDLDKIKMSEPSDLIEMIGHFSKVMEELQQLNKIALTGNVLSLIHSNSPFFRDSIEITGSSKEEMNESLVKFQQNIHVLLQNLSANKLTTDNPDVTWVSATPGSWSKTQ